MKRSIALGVSQKIIGPVVIGIAMISLTSAPAAAQDNAGDRVNQVIIYGDDDCPESTGDTITVCARLDEGERFRIPENLRESNSRQNQSWTDRARSLETVGDFGALSCSPVGAGGELGCTAQMIAAAYEEKKNSSDVRFSRLIEEARGERLSEIDAESAETQARVEELERQYMEKLEAERDAPLPDEEDAALPQVIDPQNIPEGPSQ